MGEVMVVCHMQDTAVAVLCGPKVMLSGNESCRQVTEQLPGVLQGIGKQCAFLLPSGLLLQLDVYT